MARKPSNNGRNNAATAKDRAAWAAAAPARRERLRTTAASLERAGAVLSVRALARAAQADDGLTGVYLRLRRAGAEALDEPAPAHASRGGASAPVAQPAPGGADLVAQIRAARDLEQLAAVSNEASAVLAAGLLEANTARALRALLEEQRQALVAARNAPPAAPTGELLATPDAAELVALYESVVNGRRRVSVIEFARAQALEDARDFPSGATPEQVRARLDELGLDAYGDPVA